MTAGGPTDGAEDAADGAEFEVDADVTEVVQTEVVAPAGEAVEVDGIAAAEADPEEDLLAERTADLQRVTAEYANYRKRAERERQQATDSARAALLIELLAVIDDLDRAREHGDLDEGPLKAFAERMQGLLRGQAVEAFGAPGDPFDAEVHEAVQDDSDGGEQVLGVVLRKGYRRGERLLRTAMVTVTSPQG